MILDAPTWVGQLELLGAPLLRGVDGRPATRYRRARVLVRVGGRPVGVLDLDIAPEGLDALALAGMARRAFGERLDAPGGRWSSEPSTRPSFTVVVATRDRAGSLGRCLSSLLRLDYAPFEVVVVDNAPTGNAARRVVGELAAGDDRIRYAEEPVPGLSAARNHGLRAARGTHVAFTDDDVVADAGWLEALARGFSRDPGVTCVTGLVVSGSLDLATERYVERAAEWPGRFVPVVHDLGPRRRPEFPFAMGPFGADFAVLRAAALRIGGFDEALGAGTPVGAGEELDLFTRLMAAGGAVAYEPAALVWHFPRTDYAALRRQVRSYGRSVTAELWKHARTPAVRRAFTRQVPRRALEVARRAGPAHGADATSPALERAKAWGWLTGAPAYVRGRRRARRRWGGS